MALFKKKEEYIENHGILNMGMDYHVYHMKKLEVLIALLIGFGIGVFVMYTFFRSLIFALICGVVVAAFAPRIMNRYQKKKMIQRLREQFRDLLDSLSSSYSAGRNTMGAFESAEVDMVTMHGPEAYITDEVKLINTGLQNNFNIEKMLTDFAERSGLEDVQSFADVFEVCNRQGGNIRQIVNQTRDIISEKMEIEMEIETLLSGSKNELYILTASPVVVVFVLNSVNNTASDNSLTNIVVKVVCIGIFVGAYFLGRKIMSIKV